MYSGFENTFRWPALVTLAFRSRKLLESHGYRWSSHLEPAAERPALRAVGEFQIRLGWIALTAALEIITIQEGNAAWEQVKKAIQSGELQARCRADGARMILEPDWLNLLRSDCTHGDVVWFERNRRGREFFSWPDTTAHSIPDHAEEIEVFLACCMELWPTPYWPKLECSASSTDADAAQHAASKPRSEASAASKARRGPSPTSPHIQAAAKRLLDAGHIPCKTIQWEPFHFMLCEALGLKTTDRGYRLNTVQNAVRPLIPTRVGTESTENNER
jgi:hypothetical protein